MLLFWLYLKFCLMGLQNDVMRGGLGRSKYLSACAWNLSIQQQILYNVGSGLATDIFCPHSR
jgi:hypothetical protein